jgi:hypothetical protein
MVQICHDNIWNKYICNLNVALVLNLHFDELEQENLSVQQCKSFYTEEMFDLQHLHKAKKCQVQILFVTDWILAPDLLSVKPTCTLEI